MVLVVINVVVAIVFVIIGVLIIVTLAPATPGPAAAPAAAPAIDPAEPTAAAPAPTTAAATARQSTCCWCRCSCASSSDGNARAASNVAIIGGGYLLKSGLEKRNEAQIHVQALEELGMSLEAEITPQVIELEDRSVTLSGNVEDQYAQWRSLLADIYATEIGSLESPENSAATADTL